MFPSINSQKFIFWETVNSSHFTISDRENLAEGEEVLISFQVAAVVRLKDHRDAVILHRSKFSNHL